MKKQILKLVLAWLLIMLVGVTAILLKGCQKSRQQSEQYSLVRVILKNARAESSNQRLVPRIVLQEVLEREICNQSVKLSTGCFLAFCATNYDQPMVIYASSDKSRNLVLFQGGHLTLWDANDLEQFLKLAGAIEYVVELPLK